MADLLQMYVFGKQQQCTCLHNGFLPQLPYIHLIESRPFSPWLTWDLNFIKSALYTGDNLMLLCGLCYCFHCYTTIQKYLVLLSPLDVTLWQFCHLPIRGSFFSQTALFYTVTAVMGMYIFILVLGLFGWIREET